MIRWMVYKNFMGSWEQIWQSGAVALWDVPDRSVMALLSGWKADWTIRRVLDLGCGAGRNLVPLAAEGFQAIGVDHSPAGIAECRSRLEKNGLAATLHCAEMIDLPFTDNSLDGVIAFNSIYHGPASQLRHIAASLHAKLRPGGRGFITLPSRENRMYGKGELVEPHTYINPGMFASVLPNDGERGIPHYFCSEADIQSFFAGYEILSLAHSELHLASVRSPGEPVNWLRVPKAYFWNLEVAKEPNAG